MSKYLTGFSREPSGEKQKAVFAYQQEGVLGMLYQYQPHTRVEVNLPGKPKQEMTVQALRDYIHQMKAAEVQGKEFPVIDVKVIEEIE